MEEEALIADVSYGSLGTIPGLRVYVTYFPPA
jgi:hypothetical protein